MHIVCIVIYVGLMENVMSKNVINPKSKNDVMYKTCE